MIDIKTQDLIITEITPIDLDTGEAIEDKKAKVVILDTSTIKN